MNKQAKIYVAGHRGLVGSALVRSLKQHDYKHVITRTHRQLDLTDAKKVESFFDRERPEYVFVAAAKVGGIYANIAYPADLLHANIAIQTSVLHAAALAGVNRLIFLSSSCVYPRESPQPMREEYVLSGSLEPNIEPSAIAKIAGMKMCEAYNRQYGTCFMSVIPPTLYGPNDNFDPDSSHVLSALLAKFHHAQQAGQDGVVIWGSGKPRREFLHVDDLAEACVFLMSLEPTALHGLFKESRWLLNVGSGEDMTIWELALSIQRATGYNGEILTDLSRPDGAAQKLLDSSKVRRLGWSPKVPLHKGIERTYSWYRSKNKIAA